MFVDASALVAIIAGEPDAAALATRLSGIPSLYTSPVAIYEATLALGRLRFGAVQTVGNLLDNFLAKSQIKTIPITAEIGRVAIEAFVRFGRGNHPARLNMGDCFAYACARSLSVPLLAKGEDFPQTDIELA
jgi:ribonuclease VapC